MQRPTDFRICTERDAQTISAFLYELKDELLLKDLSDAEKVTRLLFERGGAVAGFRHGQMVALCGYLVGDPADNFADPNVCFLYVAGIAPRYQRTRVFLEGYRFTMAALSGFGFREIRCQAAADNLYTNQLYGKLFRRQGRSVSRRGVPTIQYSLPFPAAVRKLAA